MVCPERKSIEPIALNVGTGDVSAMQKFINSGLGITKISKPTFGGDVAKELVPTATAAPIGVVGVVDESALTREGRRATESTVTRRSPGQGRQLPGRGISHGGRCGGAALLRHQLLLPEHWCEQTPGEQGAKGRGHMPPGIESRALRRFSRVGAWRGSLGS